MKTIIITQNKDRFSDEFGIWLVIIDGRIVFKDVYKSVCIKYAKLMNEN